MCLWYETVYQDEWQSCSKEIFFFTAIFISSIWSILWCCNKKGRLLIENVNVVTRDAFGAAEQGLVFFLAPQIKNTFTQASGLDVCLSVDYCGEII